MMSSFSPWHVKQVVCFEHTEPFTLHRFLQCITTVTLYHIWAFSAMTGFLTADSFMHEKEADMEVWLIKAQPAVSVCPMRCTSEEVLCCGPGWVTYSLFCCRHRPDSTAASQSPWFRWLVFSPQIKTSLWVQSDSKIWENNRMEQLGRTLPGKGVEEVLN